MAVVFFALIFRLECLEKSFKIFMAALISARSVKIIVVSFAYCCSLIAVEPSDGPRIAGSIRIVLVSTYAAKANKSMLRGHPWRIPEVTRSPFYGFFRYLNMFSSIINVCERLSNTFEISIWRRAKG